MALPQNDYSNNSMDTSSIVDHAKVVANSVEKYETQLLPMNEIVQAFAEVSFKYKEVSLTIALAVAIYIIFSGMTKFLVAVIEVLNKRK
jgi:hypothetical protein